MKINFKISEQVLRNNHYIKDQPTSTYPEVQNWKRQIRPGRPFPRFHIIIVKDHITLHLDKSKRHGWFFNWLEGDSGVILEGDDLKAESIRLKLDAYIETLSIMRSKLIRMRKTI